MSTVGGKLRSNFNIDSLGNVLLGGNVVAGSFLPAAASGGGGASSYGGGIIMGSFASQLSGAGFLQLSALGAISGFYGTGNLFATTTSGFRFIPFAFLDYSGDGASFQVGYALSTTQALASVDSVVVVVPKKFTISGPVTSASNISVHFMWTGLIVCAPA